jgi:hypothetical protein
MVRSFMLYPLPANTTNNPLINFGVLVALFKLFRQPPQLICPETNHITEISNPASPWQDELKLPFRRRNSRNRHARKGMFQANEA